MQTHAEWLRIEETYDACMVLNLPCYPDTAELLSVTPYEEKLTCLQDYLTLM